MSIKSSPDRGAFILAKIIYLIVFALLIYVGFEYARSFWASARAQKAIVETFVRNRDLGDEDLQKVLSEAVKKAAGLEISPEAIELMRSVDNEKMLIKVSFEHFVGLAGTGFGFRIPKEIQVEEATRGTSLFR